MPAWLRSYDRAWLSHDLVAGLIVWGVVTPQAVAYAQIAGLPPSAGLAAAPGALIAYALLGTSRTLVVSATTATSALSAAAVGPLADDDVARFAALSAGLAVVVAVVLVVAGALRLGGVMDLVSKPVMTGFLFGLGLTVALGQLSKLLGVEGTSGKFFEQLWDLLGDLGDTDGWTLVVGAASVAALVAFRRFAPTLPGMLIVLALAIVVSTLLDLSARGVDVVGELPSAFPDPAVPDISWDDVVDLLPAALGMLIVSAEAASVSRGIARAQGYDVDPNRDLIALGASNGLAGLSSGFVQSGGASQTLAAEQAGRQDAGHLARGRRADPPHGRVPYGALRGPAPGDARRHRDRRDLGLLADRRARGASHASGRARSSSRSLRSSASSCSGSCRGSSSRRSCRSSR